MSEHERERERERNRGWRPVPDPTVLTTEQLRTTEKSLRDYIDGIRVYFDERLRGMDVATRLLDIPAAKEVAHLRDSMEKGFGAIELQFRERDIRFERESKDTKVSVAAAFSAAEKAADERNKSNALAISKSETVTTETITKLAELVGSKTEAISEKVDDLKERVSRIESRKEGAVESRTEQRAIISTTGVIIGTVITILSVLALYLGVHSVQKPTVIQPTTVTVPAK